MLKRNKSIRRLLALILILSLLSVVSFPVSAAVVDTVPTGDYPEIKLGDTVTVTIETEGEIAYLKFVPATDMKIYFYSVGDDDTYGYLYDADMNELEKNDDDGESHNFKIVSNVTAGQTYYFGAKYYDDITGSFTVVLEESPIWEYYGYEDGTAYIESYNGSASAVEIPATIDGYTVTEISHYVFMDNEDLESVVIPEGVKRINDRAFYGCSNLTSVTIPESLEKVEYKAFDNTAWYDSLYAAHPDGIVYIGKTAYEYKGAVPKSLEIKPGTVLIRDFLLDDIEGNDTLTSLTIPDSVKEIQQHAFNGCSGLTSLTLPDGLEELDWCAFMDCSGLTGVNIPAGVKYISDGVFAGCTNLTSLTVDSENPYYDSRKNCNAVISTEYNELVIGCSSTVIPDSVTTIGRYAFYDCYGLTELTIPEGVITIDENSFFGCEELKSVELPDTLKTINEGAFDICSGLESVTIPGSVTFIGEDAFYGCSSLESVTIPDSVMYIGDEAFYRCTNLKNVTIPPFVKSIGDEAFGYYEDYYYYTGTSEKIEGFVIYGYSGTTAESYAEDNGFPFVSLGEPPSLNPEFIKLDEPLTVRIVNGGDTVRLKYTPDRDIKVIFTATTTDDDYTFGVLYDPEMEEIDIDYGSDKGASLKLFGSLNAGETYVFEVMFNSDWDTGSFKVLLTEAPVWEHDENTIIRYNGTDTAVTIPSELDGFEITTIGYDAFYNNKELTDITIGDNIVTIRSGAFYNCPNLKSVAIPSTVSEIEASAFYNCPNLKSVTIPPTVSVIGFYAFGYADQWWSDKVTDFTIYGYSKTAAQRYANENGFNFVCLDPPIAGDADGDGEVTSIDVTYIQRYCSGLKIDVDEDTIMNADVDENRILEIIDATLIQRYLAGMEIPFAVG